MLRSKVWTRQPPPGTPIDWDNPLTRGLWTCVSVTSVTAWDAAANTRISLNNPTTASIGPQGAGISPTEYAFPTVARAALGSVSELFVLVTVNDLPGVGGTRAFLSGQPNQCIVGVGNSSGVLVPWSSYNYPAGGGLFGSTAAPIALGSTHLLGTYSGNAQSGVLIDGLVTGTLSSSYTGNANYKLQIAPSPTGSSVVYLAGTYSRFLLPEERNLLATNPWQLFWMRRRTYSIPASTGATGSASITEGADTASATGTLGVAGSGAITEGSDAVAATGSLGDSGTASISEQPDAVAATGALSVSGTASITEAVDAVAATGATGGYGSATITEADDVVAATGTLSVSGSASITESVDATSASGSLGSAGTATITEGSDSVAATGALSVSGSAAITENVDVVAASGILGQGGVASITETADAVSASGSLSVTGLAAVIESGDIVVATGSLGTAGTATIAEGNDSVAASGSVELVGQGAVAELADEVSASGTLGSAGSASILEGADLVSASGLYGTGVPGTAAIIEYADFVLGVGVAGAPPEAACVIGSVLVNKISVSVQLSKSSVGTGAASSST